jgi:hypothetical protein
MLWPGYIKAMCSRSFGVSSPLSSVGHRLFIELVYCTVFHLLASCRRVTVLVGFAATLHFPLVLW